MKRCKSIVSIVLLTAAMFPVSGSGASAPVQVEESQRSQIQAASSNARSKMRDQVEQLPLTRQMTVAQYLDQTNSHDQLIAALSAAQQVGGTRWIDDHTCQVRMEIPGAVVADTLVQIAKDHSAINASLADAVNRRANDWRGHTFFAVGSSVGGESIDLARPHLDVGAWSDLPVEKRREAVRAAKHQAIQQFLDNIAPISLGNKLLIHDALAHPAVMDAFNVWLNRQPVTKIEFLSDLKASVSVSISVSGVTNALRSAVAADPTIPQDSIDWKRVGDAVIALTPTAVGSASAAVPSAVATQVATPLSFPTEPPAWVNQQLQSESTVREAGPRLKVARMAEAEAIEKLRGQFLQLKVSDSTTFEQLAKSDSAINEAIDRALIMAKVYKVDYLADGSVTVRVSLDLGTAWNQLRSNP